MKFSKINRSLGFVAMLCASAPMVIFAEEYRGPFPKGHPVEIRASAAWSDGISKGRILNLSNETVPLDVRVAGNAMGPILWRNSIEPIMPLGVGPKWVAGAPMPNPITEAEIQPDEYIGIEAVLDEVQWSEKFRFNTMRADEDETWAMSYVARLARRGADGWLEYREPLLSSNRVVINPDDVRRMNRRAKPAKTKDAEQIGDIERFRLAAEFDEEVGGRLYLDVICDRPRKLRVEQRQFVPEGMYIDLRTIEPDAFTWVIEANGKELARGSLDAMVDREAEQAEEAGDNPREAAARPVFMQRGQIVGRMVNIPGTPILHHLQAFFDDAKRLDATCTLTFTAACRIPTGPIETPADGEPIVGTLTARPLTITREAYERIAGLSPPNPAGAR